MACTATWEGAEMKYLLALKKILRGMSGDDAALIDTGCLEMVNFSNNTSISNSEMRLAAVLLEYSEQTEFMEKVYEAGVQAIFETDEDDGDPLPMPAI
jgi:hypothetical protein